MFPTSCQLVTNLHSFYVWPLEPADKPIIFVREEQFIQLLKEVAAKFPTLHIDPKETYFRHIKLVTSFPDHPRLLPRYLGRVKSRDEYDKLSMQPPNQRPFAFPRGEPEAEHPPSDDEVADFTDICETAIDLNRAKSRSKNKKREERVVIQANLSKQLKRAQRYFGLRARTDKGRCRCECSRRLWKLTMVISEPGATHRQHQTSSV